MQAQFEQLIQSQPYLCDLIDNIRTDANGNILYDFNGIMTCALIVELRLSKLVGHWADTNIWQVFDWNDHLAAGAKIDWYDSLEAAVDSIALQVDPDRMVAGPAAGVI